jgi:hypothetical protein
VNAELRELKARHYLFQGFGFLDLYVFLNFFAVFGILRGVSVIEFILTIFCALLPWFFSTISYITGYFVSRGVHSKLLFNLFITGGVINLFTGFTLVFTFTLTLNKLPNILIHQLGAGGISFWNFLLEILGFLILAILEKAGLLYLFTILPIIIGILLIFMGIKRTPRVK